MTNLIREQPRIDAVVEVWREALGRDYPAYRGHVYRMFNFCRALHPEPADEEAIAVAAAFPDLGIWSDDTFDYLAPSADLARAYIKDAGLDLEVRGVTDMIGLHHKVTRCAPESGVAVDAFRRADLVDLSLGLIRAGLPRSFVREVRDTFPKAGFHRRLVQLSTAWFLRHPLRPLPMFRW